MSLGNLLLHYSVSQYQTELNSAIKHKRVYLYLHILQEVYAIVECTQLELSNLLFNFVYKIYK